MGSFCSKAHYGHVKRTEMAENTQEESDSAANEDKTRNTSREDDLSPSRVVPSYSWLVASPVDFDATAKKPSGKAKQPMESGSGKASGVKYYNGEFVKYLGQPSAAELPPGSNAKQSPKCRGVGSSSSSTNYKALSGPSHGATKEKKH